MRIKLYKSAAGWHFEIIAANNKAVACSVTYATRRNAMKTAKLVAGKLKIVEAV